MRNLGRRFLAVLAILTFAVGSPAVCAGWQATPEARMACCAREANCPMHHRESHGWGAADGLTQTDADDCCMSSEPDQSNPASATPAGAISFAVLDPGIVLPLSVPALVLSNSWRTASPHQTAAVPKHVLLSVFLV